MDSKPKGKLVGQEGKRRDQVSGDILGVWRTDIIENRSPDHEYEFVHEDKVRDKLRPTYVTLKNFRTGESETHKIPAWEVVQSELSPEAAGGYRPDEGKPVDTVLRHGPYVCMRLHKDHWNLLQRAQGQRADAYDHMSRSGASRDFNESGQEGRSVGDKPYIRVKEQPLQRI